MIKKIEIQKETNADCTVYAIIDKKIPSFLTKENYPLLESFDYKEGKAIQILLNGKLVYCLAMQNTNESLRKSVASFYKRIKHDVKTLSFDLESFQNKGEVLSEALYMASYEFNQYTAVKQEPTVVFKGANQNLETSYILGKNINEARYYGDEAPNVLNSEVYAEKLQKSLEGLPVKITILNKAAIEKENMNLFLAVNNGSRYEPRFVHVVYEPKQYKKHIALVGKGITFDTGGYSLKPAASMMTMKFDMMGSATVFAAFKSAVEMNIEAKISLFIPITDNAVSGNAITPDSIVVGRSGKTVEILNTDAEGRLILADALDFACDQKPDYIVDAATLTGAVIVALGDQVTGLMSNNDDLSQNFLTSAKECDERVWRLPLFEEYFEDIKSKNAHIKNIGAPGKGGTVTAGAFLAHFIKNDIPWIHLDIAGSSSEQKHLSYCPEGASGLMIRSLVNFLKKMI
jgi:leucyl aminopeptidase